MTEWQLVIFVVVLFACVFMALQAGRVLGGRLRNDDALLSALAALNSVIRPAQDTESTLVLVQKTDLRAGREFRTHKTGDVGLDLEAWFPDVDAFTVQPSAFVKLPTGLRIKVGENAWGCIRPRSSTFSKLGLLVMEGTIDSGYTGDMFVIVYNPNSHPVTVQSGDRLAQLIPVPKFLKYEVREVPALPATERGASGFGSTGGIGGDR